MSGPALDRRLLGELAREQARVVASPGVARAERSLAVGAAPGGPVVKVAPARRGRVTGWSVVCSERRHGAMPVLAPSRAAARLAAATHLRTEHETTGGTLRMERGQ